MQVFQKESVRIIHFSCERGESNFIRSRKRVKSQQYAIFILHLTSHAGVPLRDVQFKFYTFYFLPFLSLSTIRWIKIVGDPIKSKKSNVRDVSCVAILSGRLTGVGGQSIAYVRKKQYLCRRIQRSTIKLFHNKCGCLEFSSSRCKHYVRFTSGALQGLNLNTRKRDVRSANEMRSFFEGCLMLND